MHFSRFVAGTGTNGYGPGARPIGPGSFLEPGQMGPDEPGPKPARPQAASWAHEPGRMHPLVPVRIRTGTNGLARPERKPLFLLVFTTQNLTENLMSSVSEIKQTTTLRYCNELIL